MLGFNATGRPDSKDYLLGRACLFLSELDGSGQPISYRELGNTPNFSTSIDVEELTHRASLCSDSGGAVIDRRLILQRTLNVSFTLEEFSHDNAALQLKATSATPANPAVAGIAAYNITTNAALGNWYPIQSSGGIRAMGIQKANLTVTRDPGGTPEVLTEGTDYLVAEKSGMLFWIVGGAVGAGDTIEVALAADAGAPATIEQLFALKDTEKQFALKLILENENNAQEQVELEFHSVSLAADGDTSLVGEELAQMNFTGVAENNQNIGATGATLTVNKAIG